MKNSIKMLSLVLALLLLLCGCSYNGNANNYDSNTDNDTSNDFYDSEEQDDARISETATDVQSELAAIKRAGYYGAKGAEGSTVTFGSYEQDGNKLNGSEPIEWYVISKDGNTAYLYSVYCLDCKPYNNSSSSYSVNWSNCSLRDWLNDDFYNKAFSDEEKQYLCLTAVTGNKTNDIDKSTSAYVQLPNSVNISLLLGEGEDCVGEFTNYAERKMEFSDNKGYWTADTAEEPGDGYGTIIDSNGKILGSSYYWLASNPTDGISMSESHGVRPMIAVKY